MSIEELNRYQIGETLYVHRDRGNGELKIKYIYCGCDPFNNNSPFLIEYENFGAKPVVFFDISDPKIKINRVEKIGSFRTPIKPRTLLGILGALSGLRHRDR